MINENIGIQYRGIYSAALFCIWPVTLVAVSGIYAVGIGWKTTFAISGVINFGIIFLHLNFHESPRYVYVYKRNCDKAIQILK